MEKIPGNPRNSGLKQKTDVLVNLLACCAAVTVDAIRTKNERPDSDRLRHADRLTAALKLDMTEWFTPTADNYFSSVGKQQVLDAVTETKGQPPAPALEKLKRGELASQAERLVADTGWLPKPLRLSA
jgi:ParB family transcriptional regulator, chromosome partitioning protein